jgi:hypothetical protein
MRRVAGWMAVGLLAAGCGSAGARVAKSAVNWKAKLVPEKAVKPGAKVAVQLTGVLEPGWHLYALEEPEGGPIPTVVALTEGDAAELERVTESKPKMAPDPAFGQTDGLFTGSAGFVLHARVNGDAQAGGKSAACVGEVPVVRCPCMLAAAYGDGGGVDECGALEIGLGVNVIEPDPGIAQ